MTREEFLSLLPGLVLNYRPAPDVLAKIRNLTLLIVVGPSGAGKTTAIGRLGLPYVVSDNTRPPRPEEREGVDYYFRTDYQAILTEIKAGRFVQVVADSGGDLKATRASYYPDTGLAVIAVVADAVPHFRGLGFGRTITAFITPPSFEEWMRRFNSRQFPESQKQKRLAEARRSLNFALSDKHTHLILCEKPEHAAGQINRLIAGRVDGQREAVARRAAAACLSGLNSSMAPDNHQALRTAIASYHVPEDAVKLLETQAPLIIVAPTASGKNTISEEIQKISDYRYVVTHTTRPPRPSEVNGQNYWFVAEAQMLELLSQRAFIEVNMIHESTAYGSSIQAYQSVIDGHHRPLMNVDIQGVEHISRHLKNLEPVFLLPPSFEDWMKRLDARGSMSYTEKQKRLRSARTELEEALKNRRYRLVINREVPLAAREILKGVTDPHTQQQARELVEKLIEHISRY